MSKLFGLILVAIISSFYIITFDSFLVEASTEINGEITSDALWKKENSPFNITTPLTVSNGAVLTIEPGVIINLESQLEIFGILNARGTKDDPIIFWGDGEITFAESSTIWDDQQEFGCIIQNAVVQSSIKITNSSPKLDQSFIRNEISIFGGSPLISNNVIFHGISAYGVGGAPKILNNILKGGRNAVLFMEGAGVKAQIIGNEISGEPISLSGQRANYGISGRAEIIANNKIYRCKTAGINLFGKIPVEFNHIFYNPTGIIVPLGTDAIIQNNTILNNNIGISVNTVLIADDVPDLSLKFNNFNNTINIRLNTNVGSKYHVYAINNWWGTTDIDLINATMHDFKNNENLGSVQFIPFLNTPNTEAFPNQYLGFEDFTKLPEFVHPWNYEPPKPSTPEFSVRFVAYPYDVPEKTTTTIDSFTGKETVTTIPGYHVENKSIEIMIKNQPFTPYTDDEGYQINLYYRIQVKGHFGDDWTYVGETSSYAKGPQSNAQLDSEYTIISIDPENYPNEAVLDFRVQTRVGYYVPYGRNIVIFGYDFYGQKSDWSETQTFSLEEATFEVIPEFPSWIILPLFLIATLAVTGYRRKMKRTQ